MIVLATLAIIFTFVSIFMLVLGMGEDAFLCGMTATLFWLLNFFWYALDNNKATNMDKGVKALIVECEKSLPRDENCEIIAVPKKR